jgi:protein-S-isoprenylcysteine O-methyltransferase Ste14
MYAAALLFIWAGILSHLCLFTATIGVAVTGVALARVSAEETMLKETFPDYHNYAKSTSAMVPFVF